VLTIICPRVSSRVSLRVRGRDCQVVAREVVPLVLEVDGGDLEVDGRGLRYAACGQVVLRRNATAKGSC
jgi:hypothetical protein